MHILKLLLPFLALAAPVLAQTGKEGVPDEAGTLKRPEGVTDGDEMAMRKAGKTGKPEPPAGPPGANGLAHYVFGTEPKRVPPGGSGVLLVTMVLEGDAVLASPAPMQIEVPPNQGPITLGGASLRPATESKLAKAFKGRQAYDNFAVIEVPFSVASGTAFGRYHVAIGASFDLNSGTTGLKLGSFADHPAAQIEVGPELPAVSASRGGGAAGEVTSQPAKTPEPTPAKAPAPVVKNEPEPTAKAPAAEPVTAPSAEDAPSSGPPHAESDGFGLMVGIAGVGVLVIGGLALVLKSRK